jgi:hypothetical protein
MSESSADVDGALDGLGETMLRLCAINGAAWAGSGIG